MIVLISVQELQHEKDCCEHCAEYVPQCSATTIGVIAIIIVNDGHDTKHVGAD